MGKGKKKSNETKVIFLRDYDGEVTAVFFDNTSDITPNKEYFTCYSHIGQHSICHIDYCLFNCEVADPQEFEKLWEELTLKVGYELLVIQNQGVFNNR